MWTAKTTWAGNQNYTASTSQTQLIVNNKGIPGYPYESAVLGILICTTILIILRIRLTFLRI